MESVRHGRDIFFRTVAAIAIAAVVLQPSLAVAQAVTAADLKKAEAKAEEAKAYFKSQLFAEAADAFMEAFAISKRPDMMYNAARAQEEGKLYAKALALFAR
jgi:outer membrane lipoprotein-sorting protein